MRIHKIFACLGLLAFSFTNIYSQHVTTDRVFPVTGYSVQEMGYPTLINAGETGSFTFIEFWAEGKENHPISNYYLQNYSTKDYTEKWFAPITDDGFEPMEELMEIAKLDQGYFVIGKQYMSADRRDQVVGRFFRTDGKPIGEEPEQISNYTKKNKKGFEDIIRISPNKKALLWMGSNGRQHFFSGWDGRGQEIWNDEVSNKYFKSKYQVTQVEVDDTGRPIMLLQQSRPNYSLKDTLTPPIILRYDHNEEKYISDTIQIDSAYVLEAQMKLLNNKEIVIAGVLSNNGLEGVMNGEKLDQTPRRWTHFFLQKYQIKADSFVVVSDSISAIPKTWLEKYSENGSNFSLPQMHVYKDYVVLAFEEYYYTNDRVYYYDVGCVGFDSETGEVTWTQIVEKKQRDRRDGFLSFVPGVSRGKFVMVYLTERGARGELRSTSINMKSGKRADKRLASNETARYLFFPDRSGMISPTEMILIGMGSPNQNDYKLLTITF